MTSFIAAGGSGRSTSVIPAVPAASSVTTIAFIQDLPVAGPFMPPADGRSRPPSAPRHRHRSFPHRRLLPDSLIASDTQRLRPRRRRGLAGAVSRTKADDGYGP